MNTIALRSFRRLLVSGSLALLVLPYAAIAQPARESALTSCERGVLAANVENKLPALGARSVRRAACECAQSLGSNLGDGARATAQSGDGLDFLLFSCLRDAAGATPSEPLPPRIRASLVAAADAAKRDSQYTPPIARLNTCPPPDYPSAAIRADAVGTTRMAFLITALGEVADAEVIQSAGRTYAHKMLDYYALTRQMRCRFTAATLRGAAIEAWVEMEYVWRLQ